MKSGVPDDDAHAPDVEVTRLVEEVAGTDEPMELVEVMDCVAENDTHGLAEQELLGGRDTPLLHSRGKIREQKSNVHSESPVDTT
jgi:hypothetical protein